jgi:hypothetical protein
MEELGMSEQEIGAAKHSGITAQKNKRNTACKIRPAKIHAVIDGKYAQIHQLGVFPTFP